MRIRPLGDPTWVHTSYSARGPGSWWLRLNRRGFAAGAWLEVSDQIVIRSLYSRIRIVRRPLAGVVGLRQVEPGPYFWQQATLRLDFADGGWWLLGPAKSEERRLIGLFTARGVAYEGLVVISHGAR